jgi:DNA segregation ATPase FtsK/SpoIIIE-like protein
MEASMSDYLSTNDKIETPFSDDDIERPEEENDEAPGLSPIERATRKERRTMRIKQKLDEGKQAKEELARERAEKQALAERVARLEGAVAATSRPVPSQDPYTARLAAIRERQTREYAQLQAEIRAGTYDEARAKHYEQVSAEIEDEKGTVYTERALAQRIPALRQDNARQKWEDKYPEVYGSKQAYAYAEATRNRRLALGEKETVELVDEVMAETMTALKLGKPKGPSQNERARLSGTSSSGGGGGNSGGPSGGVQMTKELRKMAVSLYSDLSEEEAVKKWVNGPGKQLRKDKVL